MADSNKMYSRLLKTVTSLTSPTVLVVGDFMLDTYIYGDAQRISPEAPVPVLKVDRTEYSCGGAGFVAADLAALGARPICVGVIGEDDNGKILEQLLQDAGAGTEGLLAIGDEQTTIKQRLIGLAQHRHPQQLMRIDNESDEELSEHQYEQVMQVYKRYLDKADVVCLQDYNKGLLRQDICQEMIALANEAETKVLVDPCLTDDYSKYSGSTLITPNRKEASLASGIAINTQDDAAIAAEQLLKNLQLDAIVVTLDREGAYLATRMVSKPAATRPRSVYDVTGAGDMVLATLAVVLGSGFDYETAVEISNITSGLEIERFGATPVTIEEVINEISGKNNKIQKLDALLKQITRHQEKKHRIAFTNGCFDVLHRGHIEFLRFCKMQGDILVVALNSDSSVRGIKGPQRPVNNQYDRAVVLAALESVDYITIFSESKPINVIKKVKPDVLIKGQDWRKEDVVGAEFVESYGGKVTLAPLIKGKSSSSTIEKIKAINKDCDESGG